MDTYEKYMQSQASSQMSSPANMTKSMGRGVGSKKGLS